MPLTNLIPISAAHYNAECEETKQDSAQENCKLHTVIFMNFLKDNNLYNNSRSSSS